ncbi:DUF2384 domain-containing protein [Sphingomonas sp. ID1715]|uniref:MbcA/ParS/Xre antitoxin family protein n=1 Tax=Sphingomonas sp. ID1715 TaxID=1656898 RepID=UPI001487C79C|nr:antitoxin Xre-like helix-turn-helix domain-containing protein [Sphingomonas sp. ID1715]NNM78582.1 DUF2384 domain-containing protein [Sphingomonas sp. ID1715]
MSKRKKDIPELIAAGEDSGRTRLRLTDPALKAFFNLARIWELSPAEQRRLLGGPSPATLRRWRRGEVQRISPETLERISFLLGIYRAITTLIPYPARAAAWMRAPNHAPLFGGRSALDVLMSGRLDDLQALRRYLDAQLV